jgi:SulP family sulfate permease
MKIGSMEFNRLELAGSLGDLGTLLPIAIGMIMVNGLSAQGLFVSVGLFYLITGWYYKITTPVQPMKVIGAYAVATAITADQIMAASLWMAVLLLVIGSTGLIDGIRRLVPKSTVRGVQMTTGILLLAQGVRFIIGSSSFQEMAGRAEPYLSIQSLGPVPLGIVTGIVLGLITLLLLENKRFPAGLIVVLAGVALGLAFGGLNELDFAGAGASLPGLFPFGLPAWADFMIVLPVLVLPQLPMTLGNAIIAQHDLSVRLFDEKAGRVTPRALSMTMSLGCFLGFVFGGMPMCHGAGGLAAHHRFGARTAGSNMMIGAVFLALALLLGAGVLDAVRLLPLAALGVLLIYAGSQLALTVLDMNTRKEMFVVVVMLGIGLVVGLAWAFGAGILIAYLLKSERLNI